MRQRVRFPIPRWKRVLAGPVWWIYWIGSICIPLHWWKAGGWREKLWVWVHSNRYWWSQRAQGLA